MEWGYEMKETPGNWYKSTIIWIYKMLINKAMEIQ